MLASIYLIQIGVRKVLNALKADIIDESTAKAVLFYEGPDTV